MDNPYQSPATADRPVPTLRQFTWIATIPQFLALIAAVSICRLATDSAEGVFFGAAIYLLYSAGSRRLIPRAHRRGMQLLKRQQYHDAISAFLESHEFFTRHAWLDRFRAITMMTPSVVGFAETALINIAFAYSQMGAGDKAKEYYQRAFEEFPESGMASGALQLIRAIEGSRVDVQTANDKPEGLTVRPNE